jgi:hypothetical protein
MTAGGAWSNLHTFLALLVFAFLYPKALAESEAIFSRCIALQNVFEVSYTSPDPGPELFKAIQRRWHWCR